MVHIKHDAELMTCLLAADNIPAGNHFVAFKDSSLNPALFSLSDDGKLNLVIEDDGEPTLMNFCNILPYEGSVLAFDVQQRSDLMLNIGWVTQGLDGGRIFLLVDQVSPDDLCEGAKLEPSLCDVGCADDKPDFHASVTAYGSISANWTIHDQSDFTRTVAGKDLPMIFLALEREDRITKEEQLGLACNHPKKILSVAFGTCPVGEGVFVLYETEDKKKLQFLTLNGTDFTVESTCPSDATCLTSFIDPTTGYSVLLIGGQDVTEMTYKQYTKSTGAGTTVVSAKKAPGLKGIHAALVDQNLTIWFTLADNSAHYYATHVDSRTAGSHIPLLKEGEGGRLSGILTVRSASSNDDTSVGGILVRTLISVNTTGDLFLLQEASDTKIWEVHPFYVGSRTDNIEVDGYALRIQAIPERRASIQRGMEVDVVAGCQLHVVSSGYTRAVVNGRAANLTRHGDWFRTDIQGVLVIIMGTDDLACHSVHVDGYLPPDAMNEDKYQHIESPLMDPSTKVSGETLVKQGAISGNDADVIAQHISQLSAHLDTHIDTQSKLLKAGTLKQFFFSDLVDSTWAFFHWVHEKAQDATSWVLDTTKSLWTLTVKLAKTSYNFLLSTAETVQKAIAWLLAKSGVAVKKLIDFAGFIFDWSDILHTSDSISTLMRVGLSYGEEKVKSLNDSIQSWVNDLKDAVQSSRADQEYGRKEMAKMKSVEGDSTIIQAEEPIKYNVAFNWVSDQINQVDLLGIQLGDDKALPWAGSSRQLGDIWDAACKEIEVIKSLVEQLAGQIQHLFGSATERNEAAIHIANTVCDTALSTIENLATVVFKAAELLLGIFQMVGETPIDIPLFTPLWHAIVGKDRSFTFFNCFALLMAIPACILHNLLYKSALPQLKGRVTRETLAGYFNGIKPTDTTLHDDLRTFSDAATIGAGYIGLAFTTISLARSIAGGSQGGGFRLAPRRRYQSLTAAGILPSGTPRFNAFWVEAGATLAQFIEVLTSFPPWEGYDNKDALKIAWVLWGLDMFWLGATAGIRLYCWVSTTGTDIADFMENPTLGGFDLVRAVVKFAVNFMIIWFEFFTGDAPISLRLLRSYLRLFDGGFGVLGAVAYIIAGLEAKSKKDDALWATFAEVIAGTWKWIFRFSDKYVENMIKESQPPDKQG